MFDSEYSPKNTLKISIGAIIKDSEILRIVPDHLKTKKYVKKAVKKLLLVISHCPDRDKTQEMCDEADNIYPSAIQLFSECYKTQETCEKVVDIFFSVKLKKIYYKVVSKEPFILKYCLDRHETQKMCGKVVDTFLATFLVKFVTDYIVTTKC